MVELSDFLTNLNVEKGIIRFEIYYDKVSEHIVLKNQDDPKNENRSR